MTSPLGVYVHFPWCLKKCPYCDFYSLATERSEIPHAAYADSVIRELERRGSDLTGHRLKSVFFGGGTPSLWKSEELERVLARIRSAFPPENEVENGVEVTAECNPSSFDARKADELGRAGVNRVSLGVQGLDAERLRFLGRLHDGPGALTALKIALTSGISRVSADLIFGVAGQRPDEAEREARTLAELGPTHISAYALTIEPGTEFGSLARRGRLPLLDDELVARSFERVARALEEAGFEHYEISNYARSGHYAEHNLGVWRGESYLGLGAGAFGTVALGERVVRYRNARAAERYLDAAKDESAALWAPSALVSDVEPITPKTAVAERLMLGLRLASGVDLGRIARETGESAWTADRKRAIDRLVRAGRLEREGDRLRIPRQAWLVADGVIRDLI
jgi:putative oxygen-independent coproporphyrinogen III oxidase